MESLSYKLTLLKEIFYPRRCRVCSSKIEEGIFCSRCRSSFVLRKEVREKEYLQKVILLYRYKGQLQEAIQQIKFQNDKGLLPFLAEEAEIMLPVNMDFFFREYDLICSIPTSAERLQRRGFDVPAEIFAFLHSEKWQADLLCRNRKTLPLFDLEPLLRKEELQGCFSVQKNVQDKKILLCDDIFTTGSTMQEAARTLLEAGACSVSALAFSASKDNW